MHYKASKETNRPIELNSLYLIDSGGQYPDGTTDITRTVAIGTPTAEMRDRFTRVLKGHIALDRAIFPGRHQGRPARRLRPPVSVAGRARLCPRHGHGVGSYLSVHEGPQRIAPAWSSQSGGDEPLQPGMILSNEPGYYKPGEYGIRIENLVLVVPHPITGAEKEMLAFETLTLAPLDRSLIDLALLIPEERQWIDDYHARVAEVVGPQLTGRTRNGF